MKAGYARIEITPQESVPMAGYSNTSARMSRLVLDPLYGTVIAFEDESGQRALVCTVDMVNAGLNCTSEVRPAMSEATGIPVSFIHISGTHTHAGPDTLNRQRPSMERFRHFYASQMARAARAAVADLEEASLSLATVRTEGMNFVRHYQLADGTWAGPNFGHPQLSPYVRHETEPDADMQLARIARKGRADILMCNFGVHQTDTGGVKKRGISADIAGVMRAEMESKTGCQFAYFTAAAGNLNPISYIPGENVVPYLDHVAHGKALAKYAMSAASLFRPAKFGAIRALHRDHEGRINHELDALAPRVKEVTDYYAATNDRDGASRMAQEKFGLSSVYHAFAVQSRAREGATNTIPADVLTVGDLAFAMAPYEMFDTNGMQIKAGSPFRMTMVLTLANRFTMGYFPTRLTFSHGSYASDICAFVPGIGEEMAELYVEMLNEIAKESTK